MVIIYYEVSKCVLTTTFFEIMDSFLQNSKNAHLTVTFDCYIMHTKLFQNINLCKLIFFNFHDNKIHDYS